MFPAIFLTATATTWYSSGPEVILGAIGPLSLGVCSSPIFAVFCPIFFPTIGPWVGSIVAYAIATLGFCVPLAFLLRWRRDRYEVVAVVNDDNDAQCAEEGIEMDEVTPGRAERGKDDAESLPQTEKVGHHSLADNSEAIEEDVITKEAGPS